MMQGEFLSWPPLLLNLLPMLLSSLYAHLWLKWLLLVSLEALEESDKYLAMLNRLSDRESL